MEFTNRQIEIIEAAKKLIGEKGIPNTTTKNIAKEMGFSEAALYRHFKNKNEILNSVLIYYREKMKKNLSLILSNQQTGLEQLKAVFKFQFAHFANDSGTVMVVFSETSFQHDKILSETVRTILNQKRTMLENIIKKGKKDGSIKSDLNYKQLTLILMGSIRMTILRWRLSNFDFDLKKEGAKIWLTARNMIEKK